MKKFVKILVFSSLALIFLGAFAGGGYLLSNYLKYKDIPLNTEILSSTHLDIPIYDKDGKTIEEDNSFSKKNMKLREVPPYVYQSFISIEDKDFYKHKGINTKRILLATLHNIKNKSFSQGASTISQQLIKNTHLSSEKTIKRKIKEIILTRKMEQIMSKEDILETYLNVIYFGNNCYGISSAAEYYFSKPCGKLTLAESATLAGIIKSPSKYSPINHPETSKQRRDLVLSEMYQDKKISEIDYQKAKSSPLILNISKVKTNKLNSYSECCIDEAKEILHIPAKQIAIGEYKIYTYQDQEEQNRLNNSLKNIDFNSCDYAGLVMDNKTHGISAFLGNSIYKILETKRQPGSCIKPILVYAPALNEDIITPETLILDEKIKIGEYAPENVNKTFVGYTSVRNAIAKSINIPAIKTLSYVGIDKAKRYAENMGIKFDKKDDNYALALGGMTYGTNLKTLCSAYSTFANNGRYSESKFISHITTKDGKVIYQHIPQEKQVLRADTCYLMTDMLKQTAQEGTAKKLASLNIEVASKTGTAGKTTGNFDAWNISYTPNKTVGVWSGKMDNSPTNIAGGNQPTEAVRNILKDEKNIPFEKPNEVVYRDINILDLEQDHTIRLASSDTPDRYKKQCIFSIFNLPKASNYFTKLPQAEYTIKNIQGEKILSLNAKKYLIYDIYIDGEILTKISEQETPIEIPIIGQKCIIKTRYINSKCYSEQII